MSKIIYFLIILSIITNLFFTITLLSDSKLILCMCEGVSDGDSISIIFNGKRYRIDIDGVDCPELGQEFGKKARQFTADLVLKKQVQLDIKKMSKYGMGSAVVFVDERDIGLQLLQSGLAWNCQDQISDDPVYKIIEKEARDKKIGLWSLPSPISPWTFRNEAIKLMSQKNVPTKKSTPVQRNNSDNQNTVMPLESKSQSKSAKDKETSDTVLNSNKTNYKERLMEFEIELKEIVETEISQLESRWDQFVNACLINQDSKKYLSGRKWFQFYEDLNKEKADDSLVFRLKYFENPTCISYETEIQNLIKSIKSKINSAEKKANNAGIYSVDISSIEKYIFRDIREWREIFVKNIIKQRDIRDYNGLIQR